MKRLFIIIFLVFAAIISTLNIAQGGRLIVSWSPPDQGNPLDHYIWSYTINGVNDSLTGWSSAQTTIDSSAVLGHYGDWAVFKIRAVSTSWDTSTAAISDTAILLEAQDIEEADNARIAFSIATYPNPASQASVTLKWQVELEDNYTIEIYNILGARVKTMRQGRMVKGSYSQAINNELATGVYFAIISNHIQRRAVKFAIIH